MDDEPIHAVVMPPPGDKPGVSADDPMSEAGRKVLAYYFARKRAEEEKVRAENASDPIHDMRVATRRLRSALALFSPFYHKHTIKPFRKTLAKVADALGAVRDMDVFRHKTKDYAESLPEAAREGLQPLLDDTQHRIDEAYQTLIDTLDSHSYQHFLTAFADFVTTPEKGARAFADEDQPVPYLVRHVIPPLIYEKYAAVRAYETGLANAPLDTLHALRIETKRLRYALEAFAEVLGPEAKQVIDAAKALQDHLGDLQDARVAGLHMMTFIQEADEQASTAAILQYMAAREAGKQDLLNGIPQAWATFTRPDLRRALALSVSGL
ncbi:MAG: CHAD domain-containing protein [Anaerolineae bacterium]|nr:CHAD domain-containing protein [Anaerolineae bacterium]